MKNMFGALGLSLALAACQPASGRPQPVAPLQEAEPTVPIPTACDIEVIFGSYAGGADGALRLRVRELLALDAGVQGFEEKPWGREGESTFCVQVADAESGDRLYLTIASWIPESSRYAPTSVAHSDGRRRAASWPQ